MRHSSRGLLAAVFILLALAVTVPVAIAHEGHGHATTGTMPVPTDGVTRSTFASLWQVGGSGVSGLVGARQRGASLVVTLVATGLEPGSKHAAHVHGPLATCARPTKRHAAELGDLVADARGVIRATRRVTVSELVVGMPGYFLMLHANPGKKLPNGKMAANPPIGCATLPA